MRRKTLLARTSFSAIPILLVAAWLAACSTEQTPLAVEDPGELELALDDHPALLLVLDEDAIDNGGRPNYFSASQVNDDIAGLGQRRPLRHFNTVARGTKITLYSGQVGDEGWFALKTIPSAWGNAGPTSRGRNNFLLAGPGLGTPDRNGDRESLLDKIPNVTPLRARGLRGLVGQRICAVVYDSDISMNYGPLNGSLKGATLGIMSFKVFSVSQLFGQSSGSLPKVVIEARPASEYCTRELLLYTAAPAPVSSSVPYDIVP